MVLRWSGNGFSSSTRKRAITATRFELFFFFFYTQFQRRLLTGGGSLPFVAAHLGEAGGRDVGRRRQRREADAVRGLLTGGGRLSVGQSRRGEATGGAGGGGGHGRQISGDGFLPSLSVLGATTLKGSEK